LQGPDQNTLRDPIHPLNWHFHIFHRANLKAGLEALYQDMRDGPHLIAFAERP